MNKPQFMQMMAAYAHDAFDILQDNHDDISKLSQLDYLEYMRSFLADIIEMKKDEKHIAFEAEMAAEARLANPHR